MAIKDKTEFAVTLFLLISLIFLTINFQLELGIIFIGMIVASMFVFFVLPSRFTHNSKPNNTFQAIVNAGIGVAVVLLVTLVLSTLFQGFLSTGQEFSILSSGFSSLGIEKIVPQAAQPIFAGNTLLTIFAFGLVIAAIETRFLGRMMEGLAKIFNVNLTQERPFLFFKIPSTKVLALFTILSALFVAYHLNAKGVTNNVALMITFIFAFVSLEMIRRSQELESATYLHVINNILYITQT